MRRATGVAVSSIPPISFPEPRASISKGRSSVGDGLVVTVSDRNGSLLEALERKCKL
jgi:hypothetical protein